MALPPASAQAKKFLQDASRQFTLPEELAGNAFPFFFMAVIQS